MSEPENVRNAALEEAAYLIDTAVMERSPETKDLDPDDKLYFEVCGELAKRIRALKRPADPPAQPRYDSVVLPGLRPRPNDGGFCECNYRCGDYPGWEDKACREPHGMLIPLPSERGD